MHFIQVLSGCFCTLLSYNLKFRFFHSPYFEMFYIFFCFCIYFLFILYIIIYYIDSLIQQKCSLFFPTNAQLPKYIPQSFATVRESFPKSSKNKIICNYSEDSIPRGVLAYFLPKSRDIQGKMPSPKVIWNAF